jgi:hypothetical protein
VRLCARTYTRQRMSTHHARTQAAWRAAIALCRHCWSRRVLSAVTSAADRASRCTQAVHHRCAHTVSTHTRTTHAHAPRLLVVADPLDAQCGRGQRSRHRRAVRVGIEHRRIDHLSTTLRSDVTHLRAHAHTCARVVLVCVVERRTPRTKQ